MTAQEKVAEMRARVATAQAEREAKIASDQAAIKAELVALKSGK